MIKVSQKCETLEEGIKFLMAGAKEDYKQNSLMGKNELSHYCKEKLENFESQTTVREGKKYIKVIYDRSVFAFIVKEDFKHFKKGDVLKPAGWAAPALNQSRGNVLEGNYPIQWTGPLYLK
jgi:hypothetical protein|tara:strand:+ start:132 stop:494 length:363 start_codon:yes stop_codon:yes gene_type:complete